MAILLAGCGRPALETNTPSPRPTTTLKPLTGQYEQSWSVPYEVTTCADWHEQMTDHQRWVMARDMLIDLWRAAGSDALPDNAALDTFMAGIGAACERGVDGVEQIVPEVAALIHETAAEARPPG